MPFPSARFYSNAYSYPYGYYPYSLVIPTYPYTTVPSYPSAPVTPTYPYGSPTPIYPYASQLPTYSTDIPTYGSSHYGAPTDVPAAPSVPAGGVQPSAETGGVSFEITPADAAVFVDGVYVGAARNFSATAPPLLLAASRHHFELRAQGYQSMTFDVDVRAGEVVPYSGTLQP